MAVIHSDVKAQLRCNENNFTTDWRDTVTSSLRDKGRGLEACRKYLIENAEIEILFSIFKIFRTQLSLLLQVSKSLKDHVIRMRIDDRMITS